MARTIIGGVLLLLLIGTPAAAQQHPKAGVSMGYPASIGLVWRVTERVAVRPDVNFSQATTENDGGVTSVSGDSSTIGVGVSGLFYTSRIDNLRPYVSPRFAYARSTNTATAPAMVNQSSKTVANSYQLGGSFGAEYELHPRFSIYGEAGLQYATSESTFTGSVSIGKTTAHGWGTRTAVGVVVYF